ncbi:MAG: rod-binding protein [Sandaracinaceae bacterium]
MTVSAPAGAPLPAALATQSTASPEDARRQRITQAATQFESLLIQQLVQVMRSTVGEGGLFGSGAGSAMYSSMFDQNLADAMSQGGGLGMRAILERSMMGPEAYAAQQRQGMELRPLHPNGHAPFTPREEGEPLAIRPASGAPIAGLTGRLQSAARAMLGPSGLAPQWGREGRLTREDLASDFATEGPSGTAVFNVEDAAGFQDRYKCNLFAFELARRAGFEVPLIGRTRGWGYMGPDGVTEDAERGRLRGDWGRVVSGESAASLDSGVVRGERAFLITGTSVGDRAGHMGMIERVHEVEYDEQGRIERVVFDGWEGRVRGARHMERRTWNRAGTFGGEDVRGGFDRIELIELRRAPETGSEERPVHPHARASVHDLEGLPVASADALFSSRPRPDRPNEEPEEASP